LMKPRKNTRRPLREGKRKSSWRCHKCLKFRRSLSWKSFESSRRTFRSVSRTLRERNSWVSSMSWLSARIRIRL
jgi:hypothetical protein